MNRQFIQLLDILLLKAKEDNKKESQWHAIKLGRGEGRPKKIEISVLDKKEFVRVHVWYIPQERKKRLRRKKTGKGLEYKTRTMGM
jgi:hypothetical protein